MVKVLAEDAAFLLAVNRMVEFRTDSANQLHKSSATVALLVDHLPQNLEVEGLIPTWERIFSRVCAHFSICGGNGIVLSQLWREATPIHNICSKDRL